MSKFGEYQGVPFIDSNEANRPKVRPKVAPKIDKDVSEIVGKAIAVNDPRLIKLAAKWKNDNGSSNTDESGVRSPSMDNHLKDPSKIADLKRVLND